jgi:Zn-finger nucleic acid-binding protein
MFVPAALVPFLEPEDGAASAAGHDALGGRCPLDQTILSRAEIEVGDENQVIHLERCSSCRSIWFDRGEWALLADRQLLDNLDQIWTAEWRTQQRRLRSERDYERRLREEFGAELFDSLHAIAAKLKGHERRSQALAFLRDASAE